MSFLSSDTFREIDGLQKIIGRNQGLCLLTISDF